MMPAGSPEPYPEYLITLIGPGSGAGDGVPDAAVRDAASGRIVDRRWRHPGVLAPHHI